MKTVELCLEGDKNILLTGCPAQVLSVRTSNDDKRWHTWKGWHRTEKGARLHGPSKSRYLSVECSLA